MWKPLLNNTIALNVLTKSLNEEGDLAYEYNPLFNMQVDTLLFNYLNNNLSLHDLYVRYNITIEVDDTKIKKELDKAREGKVVNDVALRSGFLNLNPQDIVWKKDGKQISGEEIPQFVDYGSLVGFRANSLNFSIKEQCNLLLQESYDGSVNLICTSGSGSPLLINSRFTPVDHDRYVIYDRAGSNDTNIYSSDKNALLKQIPLISTSDTVANFTDIYVKAGGYLPIGLYHIYIKFTDSDGNTTGFAGQTSSIPVYKGTCTSGYANTGIAQEQSGKSIVAVLDTNNTVYDYVTVYYTCSTSDTSGGISTFYFKLSKTVPIIKRGYTKIILSGTEAKVPTSAEEIVFDDINVLNAKTILSSNGRLLIGNVALQEDYSKKFELLASMFFPTAVPVTPQQILSKSRQVDKYTKTHYWSSEIYRLGVVFILNDGTYSSVYNIRGCLNLKVYANSDFNSYDYKVTTDESTGEYVVQYDEDTLLVRDSNSNLVKENVAGVVKANKYDIGSDAYYLRVIVPSNVLNQLKTLVKGFFFVRQKRIPNTITQGIVLGVDKYSGIPIIPVSLADCGFTEELLQNTRCNIDDFYGTNYLCEGFLSRYTYNIEKKKTSAFKKALKITAIAAIIAVGVVGSVFTCGAAGVAAGVATTAMLTTVTVATATVATTAVIGTAVVATAAASAVTITNKVQQEVHRDKVKINGRNPTVPKGYELKESSFSRKLIHERFDRLIPLDLNSGTASVILSYDAQVREAYMTQMLTNTDVYIEPTIYQSNLSTEDGLTPLIVSEINSAILTTGDLVPNYNTEDNSVKTVAQYVPEGTTGIMCGDLKVSTIGGSAEEAWRMADLDDDTNPNNSNKFRGVVSSVIGIEYLPNTYLGKLVNINLLPSTDLDSDIYYNIRKNSDAPFYQISDNIDVGEIVVSESSTGISLISDTTYDIYGGDYYLQYVTHRAYRNFNSLSSPYNDTVVDENTWKDNYKEGDSESLEQINVGDVNAVKIGTWVSYPMGSSRNYSLITEDRSHVDEILSGAIRSSYPLKSISVDGTHKVCDTKIWNEGFSETMGVRAYFNRRGSLYQRKYYGNRIVYSKVHNTKAYVNGYKKFPLNNYIDLPTSYGVINAMYSIRNTVIAIQDNAISLLIPTPGNPELGQDISWNVQHLSLEYGSIWKDSTIQSERTALIYGVDIRKRVIWVCNGNSVKVISDNNVSSFLIRHLQFEPSQTSVVLGQSEIKSFYRNDSHEVLFVYHNTYNNNEESWNLCWNEDTQCFSTFYSWIPSNVINQTTTTYSFDLKTTRATSKLSTSVSTSTDPNDVTLSHIDINSDSWSGHQIVIEAPVKNDNLGTVFITTKEPALIGCFVINDSLLGSYDEYDIFPQLLEDDRFNEKYFIIKKLDYSRFKWSKLDKKRGSNGEVVDTQPELKYPLYGLYLKTDSYSELCSEFYYRNSRGVYSPDDIIYKIKPTKDEQDKYYIGNVIKSNLPAFKSKEGKRENLDWDDCIRPEKLTVDLNMSLIVYKYEKYYGPADSASINSDDQYIRENRRRTQVHSRKFQLSLITNWNKQFLSTDFWCHSIIPVTDIRDYVFPAYWYGRQHPFEVEFTVKATPGLLAQLHKLLIVSNDVSPESLHITIDPTPYKFNDDIHNMFIRSEVMKELFRANGADITVNRDYTYVQPKQTMVSYDFPHQYYAKQVRNDIDFTHYVKAHGDLSDDYYRIQGSDISYDRLTQKYTVTNHQLLHNFNGDSQYIVTNRGDNSKYSEEYQHRNDTSRRVFGSHQIAVQPIMYTRRNEFRGTILNDETTTWIKPSKLSPLPLLPITNSPLPPYTFDNNIEVLDGKISKIRFPEILSNLGYTVENIDPTDWTQLNQVPGNTFNSNVEYAPVIGNYLRVRLRYKGDKYVFLQLVKAIIDER